MSIVYFVSMMIQRLLVFFLFLVLNACSGERHPIPPSEAPPCASDHCITIADDGTIDVPDLEMRAGESVEFRLGNRWQSIVDIEAGGGCEVAQESPYTSKGLTGPMPHLAGGLTVRGEPRGDFRFSNDIWESDVISGVLLVIPWRDLETAPGQFDFSVFTDAFEQATKYGKLVSVGVQMGAKCPPWIFDFSTTDAVPGIAMVTKATNGTRCFDQVHPQFWDPAYVTLISALQTALADALKARAGAYRHVDKIKLSGVNLLTSETRMPVERKTFCGFDDRTCSNGQREPTACDGGSCPIAGCGCEEGSCARNTGDLPQQWADAGYTRDTMLAYFKAMYAEQAALFEGKDINLMEIARAFPNVDEAGDVRGFSDPGDMRALIAQEIQDIPERFVVLNAALNGSAPPQEICLGAFDQGAKQIGFQTVNGLDDWAALEPALENARDAKTPNGDTAVSFVEIYQSNFDTAVSQNKTAELGQFDDIFRERSGLSNGGERYEVSDLAPGTYHYKIAGTHMTSKACHTGTITVL